MTIVPRAVIAPHPISGKPTRYDMVKDAAAAHGITSPCVLRRIGRGDPGWRYVDRDQRPAAGGRSNGAWIGPEHGAIISPVGILEPRPVPADDPRRWM